MEIKKLIIDFLEELEVAKNRSQKTIIAYAHYLNRFAKYAATLGITAPNQINNDLIQKFRLYLARYQDEKTHQPLAIKTQGYHLIALRSFLKSLARRDSVASGSSLS